MDNLYYRGFNKFIIQRTLAVKFLKETQKRFLLAAFLKVIIPLIIVIPGVAAYVIVNDSEVLARLGAVGYKIPHFRSIEQSICVLATVPALRIKDVAFAALTAAIVSSLGIYAEFNVYHFHHGY